MVVQEHQGRHSLEIDEAGERAAISAELLEVFKAIITAQGVQLWRKEKELTDAQAKVHSLRFDLDYFKALALRRP